MIYRLIQRTFFRCIQPWTAHKVEKDDLDMNINPIGKISVLSKGQNVAVYSCLALLLLYLKSLPNPSIPINSQDRCINEGYLSSIAAKQVISQTFRKHELTLFAISSRIIMKSQRPRLIKSNYVKR